MTDDEQRRAFIEGALAKIKQYGHTIIGVGADVKGRRPSFSYTIGLYPAHPELLVIGLHVIAAQQVLNDLSRKRPLASGDLVLLEAGTVPVKIVEADERACLEYLHVARAIHQEESFPVLQVVVPDPQGRFPGDPGCKPPYCRIPVLRRMN